MKTIQTQRAVERLALLTEEVKAKFPTAKDEEIPTLVLAASICLVADAVDECDRSLSCIDSTVSSLSGKW